MVWLNISINDFVFFVGADCLIFDNIENPKLGTPAKIEGIDLHLNKIICERANFDPSVIKPILRRIKSITKKEAIEICKLIIHPDVDYPESDYTFYLNKAQNPVITLENDWYSETLTIGKNTGAIWSNLRPSYAFKVPSSVTLFYLKNHFDLWGYIDYKLAIEPF